MMKLKKKQFYKLFRIIKIIIKRTWTKFEEKPSWRAGLKN
jgi:hypothetical protein